MANADPRSLPELLADLARDIPDLVQKEIGLARSEARNALTLLLSALRRLLLGSALAVGAIGLGLAALVSALAALLVSYGFEPQFARAVSTAAVTLLAGLAAWLLIVSATRSLEAARTSFDDSVRTLAQTLPATARGDDDDRQA
ncbi:MAG TPA: phage holin family protein [Devosia sp.]|nr:phage holin family protein [Devosia sp.]